MAIASSNPWAPWGVVQSRRDGRPVLSETQLWQLQGEHPDVLERTAAGELYVHLDVPYRVVRLPDRAWVALEPEPGRKPPAPAGTAGPGSP